MIEVTGDLWTYPAEVRVITTNGFVKKNGEAVMGRGCALEAAKRWPAFPKLLGDLLNEHGNRVHYFWFGQRIFTFPVKHAWYQKADTGLILTSALELRSKIDDIGKAPVVLPRPGCGNGQLRWEDVKPILAPILDDRFHVITFPERQT